MYGFLHMHIEPLNSDENSCVHVFSTQLQFLLFILLYLLLTIQIQNS